MTLAIFANFRIDSKERLQRMKDSYESFGSAKIDQWVINIRGKYRDIALEFLNKKIGKKLYSSQLESGKGWFSDSRIISNKIFTDYIFIWIEDHICMCGKNKFELITNEIHKNDIEYLGYSWFGNGLFLDEFKNLKKDDTENLFFLNYDKLTNLTRQKDSPHIVGIKPYIISLCGIFKKNLFFKILFSNRPYLRRWPKETPFDFEKTSNDFWILPVKFGIPKFEIFAPIDDDNRYPGSSLISRNLYPKRITRTELNEFRESQLTSKKFLPFKNLIKKLLFFQWLKTLIKRISYHL